VTSVNPNGDLAYQKRCFDQWKRVGIRAISVNVWSESSQLHAAGFAGSDLRIIPAHESGAELHGLPVPRILPLLKRLAREEFEHTLVLCNADLFAACRGPGLIREYSQHGGPVVGLTREEVLEPETHSFFKSVAYRGGIDAFVITPQGLSRLIPILDGLDSSSRMAFGRPGWDFLIGAAALRPEIGGSVMDGVCILHRSHRPSYGAIGEFGHYVDAIRRLTGIREKSTESVAALFKRRIETCCKQSKVWSDKIRLLHYTPVPRCPQSLESVRGLERLEALVRELLPTRSREFDEYELAVLVARMEHDESVSFGQICSALVTSADHRFRFSEVLLSTVFALDYKCDNEGWNVTTAYPEGNAHLPALENARRDASGSLHRLRLSIALIFGSELVDYAIFNPRLFNVMVHSTENVYERALLNRILQKAMVTAYAT
jgi:hypothetical protein